MKKIRLHVLAMITLIASTLGCSRLDLSPESVISNESFWKNESDAKAALIGAYSRFRTAFNDANFLAWFEYRAGNVVGGPQPYSTGGVVEYNANEITPFSPGTSWGVIYNVISSANGIINNVPDIPFNNESEKDKLLAQAFFLRAYAYFALVRLWGDVPIVTNFIGSDVDEQLFPERQPIDDVIALIKSDLAQASELYPTDDPMIKIKANRAAILMLKTEVYLWSYKVRQGDNADLDEAERAINEVVDNGLYTLSPQYEQVFGGGDHAEIIFSIFFNQIENTTQYGFFFGASRATVPSAHWNNPIPVHNGDQRLVFSDMFYTRYRNRYTTDSRAEFISDDLMIGDKNVRWTNKYMGELIGNDRLFTSNTIIYRFAEAILFKAEVLIEKGQINDAAIELNRIAHRAYGVDNLYPMDMTQRQINQYLLDERMVEFAGEGKSWMDLVRFGEAFNRVPSLVGRRDDKNGNVLYLPVALTSITNNPRIKQTEGY